MERHQGRERRADGFHHPAQDQASVSVPLNTLALSLLPPRPENGEDGIIFPLVKKPDNVAKYVRRIKEKDSPPPNASPLILALRPITK